MKVMKVLLVEDEPSAARLLSSVIELKCSGFEIAGVAENGEEGLVKIRLLRPDVVITDIKMPVMDGIGLVTRIKEEFPDIYSIIVSGYQDFEYAKGAIRCGVVDYLLKPVNAGQLNELLGSVRLKLEKEYHEKRVSLLGQILAGAAPEAWLVEKYLPFKGYRAALLRKNGLPSRFSSKNAPPAPRSFSGALMPDAMAAENSVWVLPGRDELERVFFHTPETAGNGSLENLVACAAEKMAGNFNTIVLQQDLFGLADCKEIVAELYRTLDNNTVLGFSQIIRRPGDIRPHSEDNAILDGALDSRIGFLASNGMYEELKQELIRLFGSWEKERRPQLWVESVLRQLLHRIEKHSPAAGAEKNIDVEFLLDEALYYSTTFGELMANIWELVERVLKRAGKKGRKVDTPDFLNSVDQYLSQNLSEQLSLQAVCSVFGISQTYLSRLFRKYKNMSFNEYLTVMRVDKAKELILQNPGMPLKDVASFVGYNDQFYFSRVFRAVTGVPPSEYAQREKRGAEGI